MSNARAATPVSLHGAGASGRASTSLPSFKTGAAFCAEYEPLEYVVEPFMRTSSVYSLTAKTGAGKTGFFTVVALSVATGRRDLIGMDVAQGRVAYLAFENPDDVRMRLKIAAYHFNIDVDALAERLVILDVRQKPEVICELLTRETDRGPFALVLLDTFAAGFDGADVNDNVQAGEFVRRLRPLTQVAGRPTLVLAAHPVKNASDEQLVPYGGGAILNEVDGNLTLAKKEGVTTLHWQGKFRGLEFSPRSFRFELIASPDVVDKKGRQVELPVVMPISVEDAEDRKQSTAERQIVILQTIRDNPQATRRDLVRITGIPKSSVDRTIEKLEATKLIETDLKDRPAITKKGVAELSKLERK